MTEPAPRSRRVRTATESLLSIVLGLEAALLFFVTITVFGLRILPAGIAFGAGAGLFVVFIVAAWAMRYRWGVWFGWLLQAVLIATGFLTPLMFVIGAGFAAMWIFCFITARRLDARTPPSDLPAKETP